MANQPEVWLRGPLPNIPALLQPVAHALLQSQEEVRRYTSGFPDHLLWITPGGAASAAFHLQHLTGVLDRLFTYARNQQLTEDQLLYLRKEGQFSDSLNVDSLVIRFDKQIEISLDFLKNTDPETLTDFRSVGRQGLPSTLLGLLVHAAEHTQRHVGQLYVTIQVAKFFSDSVKGGLGEPETR